MQKPGKDGCGTEARKKKKENGDNYWEKHLGKDVVVNVCVCVCVCWRGTCVPVGVCVCYSVLSSALGAGYTEKTRFSSLQSSAQEELWLRVRLLICWFWAPGAVGMQRALPHSRTLRNF